MHLCWRREEVQVETPCLIFARPFLVWLQGTILIKDKVCGGEAYWLFGGDLVGDVHKDFALKLRIGWPVVRADDGRNSRCFSAGKVVTHPKERGRNPAKNDTQHREK